MIAYKVAGTLRSGHTTLKEIKNIVLCLHINNLFFFSVSVFKVDKWVRAQQALYNCLMTTKSGQGNTELSAAHAWTVKAWSFYKDHLLKAPSLVSHDVSFTIDQQHHTTYNSVLECQFDFMRV